MSDAKDRHIESLQNTIAAQKTELLEWRERAENLKRFLTDPRPDSLGDLYYGLPQYIDGWPAPIENVEASVNVKVEEE